MYAYFFHVANNESVDLMLKHRAGLTLSYSFSG